ncbi:protein of unknown function [Aminobacter niigataensis]|nr:protein of unknown function [Aminobacter niigataensis]
MKSSFRIAKEAEPPRGIETELSLEYALWGSSCGKTALQARATDPDFHLLTPQAISSVT